jgi:site-specific recombinase XerD
MSTDTTISYPAPSNRYPYLTEFLKHFGQRMQAAKNTLEAYEDDIKQFYNWLLSSYGYNDVTRLTRDHFYKFRDYLEQQRYATATMQRRFSSLSQFIGYLVQTEVIKEEKDPYPPRINIRGEKPLPHLVPTPGEIFRIRMRPSVRMEHAWFFELGLSTGMRTDEIIQLHASYFNFDDRPWDKELGRPSPYFAGSIQLSPRRMTIKTKHPRKVYFSHLSGILTKEFLKRRGLRLTDDLQIFPWVRQNAQDWMRKLGEGIIDRPNPNAVGDGLMVGEIQADRYFSGVDADELEVDDKFKRLIKRRQEDGAGLEDYKRQAAKPMKTRRRHLHPHSLRHAFTPFMYYRNPFGERSADSTLRLLLGHRSYDTTFTYLRDLPLVDNDATWKHLWLGNPHDWGGINR